MLAPHVSGSGQLRSTGGEVVLAGGEPLATTSTVEGLGNGAQAAKLCAECTRGTARLPQVHYCT